MAEKARFTMTGESYKTFFMRNGNLYFMPAGLFHIICPESGYLRNRLSHIAAQQDGAIIKVKLKTPEGSFSVSGTRNAVEISRLPIVVESAFYGINKKDKMGDFERSTIQSLCKDISTWFQDNEKCIKLCEKAISKIAVHRGLLSSTGLSSFEKYWRAKNKDSYIEITEPADLKSIVMSEPNKGFSSALTIDDIKSLKCDVDQARDYLNQKECELESAKIQIRQDYPWLFE